MFSLSGCRADQLPIGCQCESLAGFGRRACHVLGRRAGLSAVAFARGLDLVRSIHRMWYYTKY